MISLPTVLLYAGNYELTLKDVSEMWEGLVPYTRSHRRGTADKVMRQKRIADFDAQVANTRCAFRQLGIEIPRDRKEWEMAQKIQSQHMARQPYNTENPRCISDLPDQKPRQSEAALRERTDFDERYTFPRYDLPPDLAGDT